MFCYTSAMSSYLGQNFLTDSTVIQHIISHMVEMQTKYQLDRAIEIGPGKGAITQMMMTHFPHIHLIEKDSTFKSLLHLIVEPECITRGDVLQMNPSDFQISPQTLLYGSLPYYITSPIISQWMIASTIRFGLFIVQKEFAEKIATTATKKSYLRRLLNYSHQVDCILTIPATSFTPAPQVQSCLIEMRKSDPMFDTATYDRMLILLDCISGYKRKTLSKIRKILWDGQTITSHWLTFTLAPEMRWKRLEEVEWSEMYDLLLQ